MKLAAKYRSRIEEEWHDEDGHWVALKSGWQDNSNPQCHTIREDTQRECYELVRASVPCACLGCRKDAAERNACGLRFRQTSRQANWFLQGRPCAQ